MPIEVLPFILIIIVFAPFAFLLIPNVPYYIVTYYLFHGFWLSHVQPEPWFVMILRAIVFWALLVLVVLRRRASNKVGG